MDALALVLAQLVAYIQLEDLGAEGHDASVEPTIALAYLRRRLGVGGAGFHDIGRRSSAASTKISPNRMGVSRCITAWFQAGAGVRSAVHDGET
jgi:hypothetical protein